ncbi:MAG: hypothetical protein AB9869_13915 [Verrucomicrobiia bacterium]
MSAAILAFAAWTGANLSSQAAFFLDENDDGAANISSQLSMTASAVKDGDNPVNLTLTFQNLVGTPSSVTEIYIDFPPPGADNVASSYPYPYFTGEPEIVNGGTANFVLGAKPEDLPGGLVPYSFVVSIGAAVDVDKNTDDGLNDSADSVALTFELDSTLSVDEVLKAISDSALRAGVHVRNVGGTGASQTYITGPQPIPVPVPEPTTILAGALLLLPFGVSAFRVLRRNKV